MGEKEVENGNVVYGGLMAETDVQMNVELVAGERVIASADVAQVEPYHPERCQPRWELCRRRQVMEAR